MGSQLLTTFVKLNLIKIDIWMCEYTEELSVAVAFYIQIKENRASLWVWRHTAFGVLVT